MLSILKQKVDVNPIRPKLIEALGECRKTGSTLIVAKLDRLSRNVAFTSKLLESDVEIVFCDFPNGEQTRTAYNQQYSGI